MEISVHARLAHRVVKDAKVQAFNRKMLQTRFYGGLVLDEGNSMLRHRRGNKPIDQHEDGATYPHRVSGEFIYGGGIDRQFGHFMSEMVHRIVPSKLLFGAAPFIFVSANGTRKTASFDALPLFARGVFDLLGITRNEFHLVTENTVIEQISVVEQGSELGLGPKPGYLDDLREYVIPRLDALHGSEPRPKKVYVSRRRVPTGLFLGERYIEEQLAAEGFAVVYPELLPVSVQMDIYRKAEILVFPEGSACHGVELLGSGSLRRCYLIARRDTHSHSFEQILQPRAEEFATSVGHLYIGTKFTNRATQQPCRSSGVNAFNAKELVAFFRSNDIARLPHFSSEEYYSTAEVDLQRYLKGSSVTGSKVLRRIIRAVFPNQKIRRTRPDARRELNNAFREILDTTHR